MRSRDLAKAATAPFAPLLVKETREVTGGRALWIMLLLICPLVGYSFLQAVSLYSESSLAAQQSPALAVSLSPLDGILVPTFGSLYVAVTLLFPFVAIRALSHEKESGSLKLLLQLPYGASKLMLAKILAVMFAWLLVSLPVTTTLLIWLLQGGHFGAWETLTLILGHALYGALVGAIALFCASVTESAASAAILALAFTVGSWALDFTIAGRPGFLDWIARLSLTQVIKPFEQGLLSVGQVMGSVAAIIGFVALAGIWLHPGQVLGQQLRRSLGCAVVIGIAWLGASHAKLTLDVSEDQRNSFPLADQRALARLPKQLEIIVHLASEDPRYLDFQRNILAKLERAVPRVAVRLANDNSSEESYGEVQYRYGDRTDVSRSTSYREVLPLIYGLAEMAPPAPVASAEFPGYPLTTDADLALLWFFIFLPILIAGGWWWTRRPPAIEFTSAHQGGQS